MPATLAAASEIQLSLRAQQRLKQPLRRGTFRPVDAARAQLGLLTVADDMGQACIYWLIDLNTHIVEDARFLAFGSLASHPIADCWTDRVRGMSVAAACEVSLDDIESALRDSPDSPACGPAGLQPFAFVSELQSKALAALPTVRLLPKPVEVERYQRKREADWSEADRGWLPLSLMKKVMRAQTVCAATIAAHVEQPVTWSIEGLHDDFQVVIDFSHDDTGNQSTAHQLVPTEQRPTLIRMIEEALRSEIHPAIQVEERTA